MANTDLVQVLLSGVAMGSIYTLMGKGLLVTYLTTRALNFGQGDFLMVAAFISMALIGSGVPVLVAAAVVLAILAVLGIGLERIAIRPLAKLPAGSASGLAWILTTMGFGLIIQNMAQLVWGKSRYYSPPLFGSEREQVITVLGVRMYAEELLVSVVALLVVALFYWLLFRARWGRQVRVVYFDKATAALLGINVRRVVITSYILMACLAAISGMLAGPLTTVHSHMGLLFLLKGFAVVCIGGFANPLGVLIAGLGFGIVEALSNYVDSAFGDLYPFVLAVVFLIARPSGLFGAGRAEVR